MEFKKVNVDYKTRREFFRKLGIIEDVEICDTEFLSFTSVKVEGRKTKIVTIVNKSGRTVLGEIRWYPTWRRYVWVVPASSNGFIFDNKCLEDINNVIKLLMEERLEDK